MRSPQCVLIWSLIGAMLGGIALAGKDQAPLLRPCRNIRPKETVAPEPQEIFAEFDFALAIQQWKVGQGRYLGNCVKAASGTPVPEGQRGTFTISQSDRSYAGTQLYSQWQAGVPAGSVVATFANTWRWKAEAGEFVSENSEGTWENGDYKDRKTTFAAAFAAAANAPQAPPLEPGYVPGTAVPDPMTAKPATSVGAPEMTAPKEAKGVALFVINMAGEAFADSVAPFEVRLAGTMGQSGVPVIARAHRDNTLTTLFGKAGLTDVLNDDCSLLRATAAMGAKHCLAVYVTSRTDQKEHTDARGIKIDRDIAKMSVAYRIIDRFEGATTADGVMDIVDENRQTDAFRRDADKNQLLNKAATALTAELRQRLGLDPAPATAPATAPAKVEGVQRFTPRPLAVDIRLTPALAQQLQEQGKRSAAETVAGALLSQVEAGLAETRKFQVVARANLRELIDEQAISRGGDVTASDLLLCTDIDTFHDEVTTVPGGQAARRVEITAKVSLYDRATGKYLDLESPVVRVGRTSEPKALPAGTAATADMFGTLLADVITEARMRIVNKVIDQVYPPMVLARNGSTVDIDRGRDNGVGAGQIWEAWTIVTRTDPRTGAEYRMRGALLGRILIDSVESRTSRGTIQDGSSSVEGIVEGTNLFPTKANPAKPRVAMLNIVLPQSVLDSADDKQQRSLRLLRDQLTKKLPRRVAETGCFTTISESGASTLKEFIRWSELADTDPTGPAKERSAQWAVETTITAFEDVQGAGPNYGDRIGKQSRRVRVSGDMSIRSVATGEEQWSGEINMVCQVDDVRKGPEKPDEWGLPPDVSHAVDQASTKLARRLTLDVMRRLVPVSIMKVDLSGEGLPKVTVNAGDRLLEVGERLTIAKVIEPSTGGGPAKEYGPSVTLLVRTCMANTSIAQVESTSAPAAIADLKQMASLKADWHVIEVNDKPTN